MEIMQPLPKLYRQSQFQKKIAGQDSTKQYRAAVFTDIDNTLWHPSAIVEITDVADTLHGKNIPLVAVTGLSFDALLDRMALQSLPPFDIVAAELGSKMYIRDANGGYAFDEQYQRFILSQLVSQSDLLKQFDAIPASIKTEFGLTLQDDSTARAIAGACVSKLGLFASMHGSIGDLYAAIVPFFSKSVILISKHVPGETEILAPGKYCVDVARVTKRTALNYLTQMFGITHAVAAGDGGNDFDMLFASTARFGILVGASERQLTQFISDNGVERNDGLWEYDHKFFYSAADELLGAKGLSAGLAVLLPMIDS